MTAETLIRQLRYFLEVLKESSYECSFQFSEYRKFGWREVRWIRWAISKPPFCRKHFTAIAEWAHLWECKTKCRADHAVYQIFINLANHVPVNIQLILYPFWGPLDGLRATVYNIMRLFLDLEICLASITWITWKFFTSISEFFYAIRRHVYQTKLHFH